MNVKRLLSVIALSVLGLLGISQLFKFSQFYQTQKQFLNQAAPLMTEVEQRHNLASVNDLTVKQKQLQDTIGTLSATPNLPGFDYDKAQADLIKLRTLDQMLNQRIQTETQAATNLEAARKLDGEAAELLKEQPSPPEAWQAAKDKWQAAITLLEKIPADTFVSAQAQAGLNATRINYKTVSQTVVTEEKAIQQMDAAMETAERAASLTRSSPYKLTDLINAKTQWTRAISLVRSIPNPSSTATDARQFLQYYQRNLEAVESALTQVKGCLAENNFDSLCGHNVSLDIEMPPIEVALDSDEAETGEAGSGVETTLSPTVTPVIVSSRYRHYRASTAPSFSGGSVYVQGHTRSDGTYVRGHSRSSGSRSSGFGYSRSGGASS